MIQLGDLTGTETIVIPFSTYGSSNQSITLTGLATSDIEVYKGSSMTQRSSDAGYTLLDTDGIDIDTITGIHGFSIDLSDNTDAGFFAAGNDYFVVVSSVTVDSQTVSFIAATFSIQNRFPYVYADGPIPILGVADSGTAQSAAAGTLQARSGASFADDTVIGFTASAFGSTQGYWQSRIITDNVGATDTFTVDNWTVTPSGTISYVVHFTPPASDAASVIPAVDVTQWNGTAVATPTVEGVPEVDITHVAGTAEDLPTATALATVDTNVDAILVDTGTTLPASIATIDSNVDDLKLGVITGAAATGTLSTTQATTNLTGYADDQLIGRVIIWTSGAAEGEGTDITDYANASGLLTFTALTTAPGNGDTFKIV